MDLREPASIVMPPGTAAIIRALAGTNAAMTVRQVARVAGVSHQRASQVVQRLTAHGLVTTEPQGPSLLCRLNRNHLAAPAVTALAQLRSTLLTTLAADIEAWPVRPVHASLFGSAARADGSPASDIDVLLVRVGDPGDEGDDDWAQQLAASGVRLQRATGNRISWFDISTTDLTRAVHTREAIVEEWRRDAVRLVGPDLSRLLREAS